MAGADSVEKLEDVIVRSAEQVAGQIRAAKEAIGTVIFGQDRVIENTLVTILSGGHALLIGVSGKRSFRFIAGPVFAQLLMADEINRASPRTQSALLQAMQEQHITVAGAR